MALKLVTNVVSETELRKAQLRALSLFAETVKGTYGPMGEYTAYSMQDPNNKLKAIAFEIKYGHLKEVIELWK